VDQDRKHAPLSNFTMCNLMAEGMLTAKNLFPDEFANYEFDEVHYLRRTFKELRKREGLGVDVSVEMNDLRRYAVKYPALLREFDVRQRNGSTPVKERLARGLRATIGDLGARAMRRRLKASQLARQLDRGELHSKFSAFGEDFGFFNVLECAKFLSRVLSKADDKADPGIAFRGEAARTEERPE
jgi:hypothetical protein